MKKLIFGVGVVALMFAASMSFVSCNDDYVQDQLTELRDKVRVDSTTIMSIMEKSLHELESVLTKKIDEKESSLREHLADTLENYVTLTMLQDSLNRVRDLMNDLYELNKGRIDYDSIRIDSLFKYAAKTDAFAAAIGYDMENGNLVLSDKMKDAIKTAFEAEVVYNVDSIAKKVTSDSLNVFRQQLNTVHQNIYGLIDSLGAVVKSKVDTSEWKAFISDYNLWKATIDSSILDLQDQIDSLGTSVNELKTWTNQMKDSYDAQITSIVLQGTYNNVFGSIRLPFDFQSMLVAGHYGTITADGGEVVFPKRVAGVTPSKSYTFQNGETNRETSGYAYLTINPNTVDIAGVKFSLVNSLDSTIGFKIDTVVKSNDKLSFGWTRADNGFYRAAISTDENVSIDALKPRIDLNDIKSVIKNAINDLRAKKMFDLSSIARVIYENSTDILDATAIKATWTDGFGNEKSVYTNYDMAATVMKPLSFEFNIDYYADKLAKQLEKLHVNTISDVAFDFNLDINYVKLDTISETTYPIVIIYNGTRDTINGIADLCKFVEKFNLYYTSQTQEINDLIDEIKEQSKKEFDRAIDKINNDYVHKINNYINKYNNYLTRLTNKIVDIDFNHYLQPCILISTDRHFGQVSTNSDVPTFAKGESVILTPTSYTSELIAPAMYKYLAVASVKDLAGNEISGAADKCNNADYNMNVPFANKQQVVLVMPESNALYEINYQAIDWSGKTVSGTYYIQSL